MKQWRHLRIFSNHRGDTGIPLVISPLFKPDKFNSINLSNQFLSFPKNTEFTLNEVIRGGEQSRVVAGPISTLIQNNELEVRMQKYRAVSCHQFLFPSPDRADDISAKGTTFTNTSISLCRVTDTFTRKKKYIFNSYTSAKGIFIFIAKCSICGEQSIIIKLNNWVLNKKCTVESYFYVFILYYNIT